MLPEHLTFRGVSLLAVGGLTLALVANGAPELVYVMVLQQRSWMGRKWLKVIGHPGIIETEVTRDTPVNGAEIGNHYLSDLDAEAPSRFDLPLVLGLGKEKPPVLPLGAAPLVEIVLLRRGREQEQECR
jgi:hypothetical protein